MPMGCRACDASMADIPYMFSQGCMIALNHCPGSRKNGFTTPCLERCVRNCTLAVKRIPSARKGPIR